MENYSKKIYEIQLSGSIYREEYRWGWASLERNYRMYSTNDYFLYFKTQSIMKEFIQIITFINELERCWLKKIGIHNQIDVILQILESNETSSEYLGKVNILSKYLSGIRNFLDTTNTKSIVFYKKLFESTLFAITQDLHSLQVRVDKY